jgi:hypothetical protein
LSREPKNTNEVMLRKLFFDLGTVDAQIRQPAGRAAYSAAFPRCTLGPARCRLLVRSTAKPAGQFQRTKALLCFK